MMKGISSNQSITMMKNEVCRQAPDMGNNHKSVSYAVPSGTGLVVPGFLLYPYPIPNGIDRCKRVF